jgi:hypothetical protein
MAQTVTPLPSIGEVIEGQDVAGRELRISGHPDSDRVVLSIWQSGRCLATVRLARADVPEVANALITSLVPVPVQPEPSHPGPTRVGATQPGPTRTRPIHPETDHPGGTVHELHPPVAETVREATVRLAVAVSSRLTSKLRRPRD